MADWKLLLSELYDTLISDPVSSDVNRLKSLAVQQLERTNKEHELIHDSRVDSFAAVQLSAVDKITRAHGLKPIRCGDANFDRNYCIIYLINFSFIIISHDVVL